MYSNSLICKILIYIENNLTKKITINELSAIYFYDKTYIMKLFKKEIGISIIDYINKKRILDCCKQINSFKSEKLLKIAYQNGFSSLEYFSELFKREIGTSPRIYQNFIKKKKISEEDYYLIISNLMNLQNLKNKVDQYLFRQKPKDVKVKKLTIFKSDNYT